jgi:prepilin-type N-terminal cleavage/methylation domain-containing protein
MKKSKAKNGFTLIEIIIVIAIIAILATIVTPKFTRYITEAKKTQALSEVRAVVLGVNVYNTNSTTPIGDSENFTSISGKIDSDLVDCTSIKSIAGDMTFTRMKELLTGTKALALNDQGKIIDTP